MDEPSLPVEASFEKDGAQERIPPGELTCGGVGDHGGAVHPAARRRVVEALDHAVNQLADLPVARANYVAAIDDGLCMGCRVCVERCIDCGLCVTGCPHDAVTLSRLPDAQTVHPPTNYETWERERLRNRGMA